MKFGLHGATAPPSILMATKALSTVASHRDSKSGMAEELESSSPRP